MCVVELSTNKFWRPLLYCAVGLSLVLPLSALKCEKTESTCTQLLEDEFWPDLDTCEQRYDDVLYNPVINYDINPGSDTFNLFISFNANTSLIDPDRIENDWKSFLIGYTGSGCHFGSDSSHNLCYDIQNRFPTDTDTDKHDVNDTTIQVGDQCTIFGCFLYANQTANECTEYVLKDFINETILFLRECSAPDYVEHGNITSNPSEGRYVEGDYFNITCEDGFVATYGGASQCLISGNWSTGNPTSCIRKCEKIEDMTVEGGSVENSTETLVAGSVLTVTCSKYYTGGGNITCDENGTWSEPELPSCTPRQCPDIRGNITGGKLDVSEPISSHGRKENHYLPNTNISLTCGWFQSGGGSITCGVNETWIGTLPPCVSNDVKIFIVGAVLALVPFIILVGVIIVCCRFYQSYRNDKIRKFNLIFTMQARRESLDPHYTPINLQCHKKISISLSIRTTDEYSGALGHSSPVSPKPFPVATYHHSKSHSFDDVSEAPLTQSKTEEDVMQVYKNSSYPALPEFLDVVTDLTEESAVEIQLDNLKERLEQSDHSADVCSLGSDSGLKTAHSTPCTAFDCTDFSGSSHYYGEYTEINRLVSSESSQETHTNTFDNEVLEIPPTTLAGNDPSNMAGPPHQSVLSESEVNYNNTHTCLSPSTPSDVTLAFAMVDPPQPTVPVNVSITNPIPQLAGNGASNFETKSQYVNLCHTSSNDTWALDEPYIVESSSSSGYITESDVGYVADSSTSHMAGLNGAYTAELATTCSESGTGLSSGYIYESSMREPSPGYVWGPTSSSSSNGSTLLHTPGQLLHSEYLRESDVFGNLPANDPMTSESVAELPGSQQFHFGSHFAPTNSGIPGYVTLGDVNTSFTAV